MDSTGVEGRIQVNERTRDVLKQVFWQFLTIFFTRVYTKVEMHAIVCLVSIRSSTCVGGDFNRFLIFQWFEFEERGDIFVKGKDNMKVFLFTKQKESALRMFWSGTPVTFQQLFSDFQRHFASQCFWGQFEEKSLLEITEKVNQKWGPCEQGFNKGFQKFSPELERNIMIMLRERESTSNIYRV